MPPAIRYDRQQILEAALALVREEGAEALNARAVAKRLGCSTQPIFRAFANMDELKLAVVEQAEKVYSGYIESSKHHGVRPYKQTGLAYVRFAREESELFRLLFMRDRRGEMTSADIQDPQMEYVLQTLMNATGLTCGQAYTFHLMMWVYVHGLASMVATHYLDFSDQDIDMLLTQQFQGMKRGLDRS